MQNSEKARGRELKREISGLGWEILKLGKTFGGACKVYKNENGDLIPLVFTDCDVYLMQDANGVYPVQDIQKFLFNAKDCDIFEPDDMDNAIMVANLVVEDGENVDDVDVYFYDVIDEFALSDAVKQDIAKRLKLLTMVNAVKNALPE